MRKLSDWMKVYGFKDGANEDVTEAFIRHLVKSAHGVDVPPRRKVRPAPVGEQLKFDFDAAARDGKHRAS